MALSKSASDINNSARSAARPDIAVMGIGNVLLTDDGIGIHVVRNLAGKTDPAAVEVIDAGTAPDIFSLVGENINKLIIVDAADGEGKPGTIYRLGGDDIEAGASEPVSLHELGLGENLKILKLMNPKLKKVTLIGIQVADTSPGVELSEIVMAKMPKVTQLILDEIKNRD